MMTAVGHNCPLIMVPAASAADASLEDMLDEHASAVSVVLESVPSQTVEVEHEVCETLARALIEDSQHTMVVVEDAVIGAVL